MSIATLLNEIDNEEIVLPAIQRDFVWSPEKIEGLVDSIMREYPIGIILMWETFEDIQYRAFENDYKKEDRYRFCVNSEQRKIKVVLDGQQRLQSLYIALYGKYEDRELYFDVLSKSKGDDLTKEAYNFKFMTREEADDKKKDRLEAIKDSGEKDELDLEWFENFKKLYNMSAEQRIKLKTNISEKLRLPPESEVNLDKNLQKIGQVIARDENLLKTSIIDANKPTNSEERKTQGDILEIFVRVNRLGTPLDRSDIIFGLLKLNWKESAITLPDFVKEINRDNNFEIDKDFVIRCLFAVSDMGSKLDIDLLRNEGNIKKFKDNFDRCCKAIKSTLDHVKNECWCNNSDALGHYNTLVPFVYYLYHMKRYDVPNSELLRFRKALYLFGFTRALARYADSRIAKFIREELKPLIKKGDNSFPFSGVVKWLGYWEGLKGVEGSLVQSNRLLALSLIQGHSRGKRNYEGNNLEQDHIFPRSELREKGYEEYEVSHFANFWLLSKGKNRNKSNKHPKKYFADVDDSVLRRALIDRELLDYRRYKTFLKTRSGLIISEVSRRLEFAKEDFEFEDE